jgi:hypothetical protein
MTLSQSYTIEADLKEDGTPKDPENLWKLFPVAADQFAGLVDAIANDNMIATLDAAAPGKLQMIKVAWIVALAIKVQPKPTATLTAAEIMKDFAETILFKKKGSPAALCWAGANGVNASSMNVFGKLTLQYYFVILAWIANQFMNSGEFRYGTNEDPILERLEIVEGGESLAFKDLVTLTSITFPGYGNTLDLNLLFGSTKVAQQAGIIKSAILSGYPDKSEIMDAVANMEGMHDVVTTVVSAVIAARRVCPVEEDLRTRDQLARALQYYSQNIPVNPELRDALTKAQNALTAATNALLATEKDIENQQAQKQAAATKKTTDTKDINDQLTAAEKKCDADRQGKDTEVNNNYKPREDKVAEELASLQSEEESVITDANKKISDARSQALKAEKACADAEWQTMAEHDAEQFKKDKARDDEKDRLTRILRDYANLALAASNDPTTDVPAGGAQHQAVAAAVSAKASLFLQHSTSMKQAEDQKGAALAGTIKRVDDRVKQLTDAKMTKSNSLDKKVSDERQRRSEVLATAEKAVATAKSTRGTLVEQERDRRSQKKKVYADAQTTLASEKEQAATKAQRDQTSLKADRTAAVIVKCGNLQAAAYEKEVAAEDKARKALADAKEEDERNVGYARQGLNIAIESAKSEQNRAQAQYNSSAADIPVREKAAKDRAVKLSDEISAVIEQAKLGKASKPKQASEVHQITNDELAKRYRNILATECKDPYATATAADQEAGFVKEESQLTDGYQSTKDTLTLGKTNTRKQFKEWADQTKVNVDKYATDATAKKYTVEGDTKARAAPQPDLLEKQATYASRALTHDNETTTSLNKLKIAVDLALRNLGTKAVGTINLEPSTDNLGLSLDDDKESTAYTTRQKRYGTQKAIYDELKQKVDEGDANETERQAQLLRQMAEYGDLLQLTQPLNARLDEYTAIVNAWINNDSDKTSDMNEHVQKAADQAAELDKLLQAQRNSIQIVKCDVEFITAASAEHKKLTAARDTQFEDHFIGDSPDPTFNDFRTQWLAYKQATTVLSDFVKEYKDTVAARALDRVNHLEAAGQDVQNAKDRITRLQNLAGSIVGIVQKQLTQVEEGKWKRDSDNVLSWVSDWDSGVDMLENFSNADTWQMVNEAWSDGYTKYKQPAMATPMQGVRKVTAYDGKVKDLKAHSLSGGHALTILQEQRGDVERRRKALADANTAWVEKLNAAQSQWKGQKDGYVAGVKTAAEASRDLDKKRLDAAKADVSAKETTVNQLLNAYATTYTEVVDLTTINSTLTHTVMPCLPKLRLYVEAGAKSMKRSDDEVRAAVAQVNERTTMNHIINKQKAYLIAQKAVIDRWGGPPQSFTSRKLSDKPSSGSTAATELESFESGYKKDEFAAAALRISKGVDEEFDSQIKNAKQTYDNYLGDHINGPGEKAMQVYFNSDNISGPVTTAESAESAANAELAEEKINIFRQQVVPEYVEFMTASKNLEDFSKLNNTDIKNPKGLLEITLNEEDTKIAKLDTAQDIAMRAQDVLEQDAISFLGDLRTLCLNKDDFEDEHDVITDHLALVSGEHPWASASVAYPSGKPSLRATMMKMREQPWFKTDANSEVAAHTIPSTYNSFRTLSRSASQWSAGRANVALAAVDAKATCENNAQKIYSDEFAKQNGRMGSAKANAVAKQNEAAELAADKAGEIEKNLAESVMCKNDKRAKAARDIARIESNHTTLDNQFSQDITDLRTQKTSQMSDKSAAQGQVTTAQNNVQAHNTKFRGTEKTQAAIAAQIRPTDESLLTRVATHVGSNNSVLRMCVVYDSSKAFLDEGYHQLVHPTEEEIQKVQFLETHVAKSAAHWVTPQ